ncbi:MAG: hypothetical protein HY510_02505 [Acidobacteria bacterium]|nr:hypothetical protein [Acidobacteriota bacterium]
MTWRFPCPPWISNGKKCLSKFAAASLGASAVFLVTTQLLSRFIADRPEDPGIRWLAVLTIVALFGVMVLAMRSLRRMDELERKMHTEAMAFAFLGSILLVTTCGFLRMADLLTPPVLWLPPAMVGCWVISLVVAIERYR